MTDVMMPLADLKADLKPHRRQEKAVLQLPASDEPPRKRARPRAAQTPREARADSMLAGRRVAWWNPCCRCLFSLFPDLVMVRRVMALLDVPSLASVGAVCTRWQALASDPYLWQRVSLRDVRGSLPALQSVMAVHAVRDVRVSAPAAEPEALAALAPYTASLTSLDLTDCRRATDETVVALLQRATGLKTLKLGRTAVGDATLEAAAALPQLRQLVVSGCRLVTGEGLATLAEARRALVVLSAARGPKVRTQDVARLARAAPLLRELRVGGGAAIGDEALLQLAASTPLLEVLDVSSGNPFGGNKLLSDAGVQAILEACPRLRELELKGCPLVSLRL